MSDNGKSSKIGGWAALVAAIGGLVLGILAHVRETRDPNAQAKHQDISINVEKVSEDVRRAFKEIQENRLEIGAARVFMMGYALGAGHKSGSGENTEKVIKQIEKQKDLKGIKLPPKRKPKDWDQFEQRRSK